MAEDVVTLAEFGQYSARMDERFDFIQHDIRELRTELRGLRTLVLGLLTPLVVSLSLAVLGAVVKFVFFT